jgi:hypothetical protein
MDTVAPTSTKTPTMMRSPAVTLPGKALLSVWPVPSRPLDWEADVLCTNVMGRTEVTRLMVAVWELLPTLAVTVAL